MRLRDVLKGIDNPEIIGKENPEIQGIALHSGRVREGYLFICIVGNRADGHQFIEDAVDRGATAVLCQRYPEISADTTIIVKDTRDAAARIAATFYGRPFHDLRVIGITGTNGKTTVAYVCRNILGAGGGGAGLIGTIEYIIDGRTIPAGRTTPDPVLIESLMREMVEQGAQSVVMEVSSHALHQRRVDHVEFDAAVFTNLTRDHLDYHGNMDEYLEAKIRLFEELLEAGGKKFPKAAIVNIDDPASKKIIERTRAPVLRYGVEAPCDIRASDIRLCIDETSFKVDTPSGRFDVRTPLAGRYNVYNILAAIGMAVSQEIPEDAVLKGIESTQHISGRLQFIPNDAGINVAVDYAHTDDALKNVITALREITTGRTIVLFGCGGDRDPGKRPRMGSVVCELADLAVVTSDNPRSEDPEKIIDQILEGFSDRGCEYVKITDRKEAIERALSLAGTGDTVLLAGKGHETYQEFEKKIVPFDDREVAREVLAKMTKRRDDTPLCSKGEDGR